MRSSLNLLQAVALSWFTQNGLYVYADQGVGSPAEQARTGN